MPRRPLTNFQIKRCYQNKLKFNCVYSKNRLPKIEDGTYAIYLDDNKSIGTHGIALYVKDNVISFDRFGIEHTPKEIRKSLGNKNIATSIYRIQPYDSIMCGNFCIGIIDFMVKGKSLTDFINLFLPYNFKNNDKIILNIFF